jgi:hypothetical protein
VLKLVSFRTTRVERRTGLQTGVDKATRAALEIWFLTYLDWPEKLGRGPIWGQLADVLISPRINLCLVTFGKRVRDLIETVKSGIESFLPFVTSRPHPLPDISRYLRDAHGSQSLLQRHINERRLAGCDFDRVAVPLLTRVNVFDTEWLVGAQ